MNQYRCETCEHMKTHTSKGGLPFEERCEASGYPPRDKIFENKLACVGCASHSDFQSERDKVLDETSNGVVLWSPAHIFRLICRLDETELEYLLSDIRWLQERNFKRNHPELRQVNHEPV